MVGAGRHYLVTGGAGFIGSHLVERLAQRGDAVVVLDDLSTGDLANLAALTGSARLRFVRGSVLDAPLVDELVAGVDAVAHLAATVGVDAVLRRPAQVLTAHVRGAEVVLAAAARHGCRVLLASSSEVYGKNPQVPLREDADLLLGPTTARRWAYATSKAAAEVLALAHHRDGDLPVVVARLFNTVGPRQSGRYGMVLPRLVDQALSGRALTVYGDGRQTRCLCDVDDVVAALVTLLDDEGADGQVLNVGSTEEVAVLDLARRIAASTGSRAGIRLVPYEEAYGPGFEDVRRRVPDTRKIRALTGWSPRRGLDDIVGRIIASGRACLAASATPAHD